MSNFEYDLLWKKHILVGPRVLLRQAPPIHTQNMISNNKTCNTMQEARAEAAAKFLIVTPSNNSKC